MISDEKIIGALVSCNSIREAALTAGVSEGTIYTRLRENAFSKALELRRLDLLQGVVSAAQENMLTGIETIKEIASDKNVPAKDRLLAAERLIAHAESLSGYISSRRSSMRIDEEIDKSFNK